MMECEPTDKVEMVYCVELSLESDVAPIEVEPSNQLTVLVGAPLVEARTTALKVTDCPKLEGFRLEVTVVVVAAALTICCKADDVLEVTLASPLYLMVIQCVPTEKVATESCAALADTAAVPRVVEPSRKVNTPVAVPPKAGWTLAASTMFCAKAAGFTLEVTATVEDAKLMVCASAAEELGAKLEVPEYCAAMEWGPAPKVELENCAEPLARDVVERTVEPS